MTSVLVWREPPSSAPADCCHEQAKASDLLPDLVFQEKPDVDFYVKSHFSMLASKSLKEKSV